MLCKYAKIGCEEEPLRKDLQQHENDAILHLPVAIEIISELQDEIDELKDEISELKDEIDEQQEEIDELREEVKAVKEEQKIMVMGDNLAADSCAQNIIDTISTMKSGSVLHSIPTQVATRCVSRSMPMGLMIVQTLMSQCLPT